MSRSQPPLPAPARCTPLDLALAQMREEARQRLQALSRFRRSAAGDPPISHIVSEALDLAWGFLSPDRCVYGTRRSDEEPFRLTAGAGWDVDGESLSGDADSLGAYILDLGRPLVVEDLRLVPQFRSEPVLVAGGTTSVLLAPVRGQNGGSGLLGVFSSSRRLFTPDDAEFLHGLADVIAAALYRADWRLQNARSRTPRRSAPE
jgi:GAF domain-containing protein